MAQYKIISQQTPFKFTTPIVLVVDAIDRENAFIENYKQLTKLGYNVETDLRDYEGVDLGIDIKKINIPYFQTTSVVKVRNITEFIF